MIYTRTNEDLTIWLYTIIYNEEKILPYFINYYSNQVDKIIIYDNQSTDRSVEIANSYPNVQVIELNTDGKFSELRLTEVRNNCWKSSEADYCLVCDVDEFIYYSKGTLKDFLLSNKSWDVYVPIGFNMISRNKFPPFDGSSILKITEYGSISEDFFKPILFNRKTISFMGFAPGSHYANPTRKDGSRPKIYDAIVKGFKLRLLHYKYIDLNALFEKHAIDRRNRMNMSEHFSYLTGIHYLESIETLSKTFDQVQAQAIKIVGESISLNYKIKNILIYRFNCEYLRNNLREKYFVPLRKATRPARRFLRSLFQIR